MSDYTQADHLTITYSGAAGQTFALEEGRFCEAAGTTCQRPEPVIGTASFADRQGTLAGAGGRYAIYVDSAGTAAWTASCTGMDVASFKALTADLILVIK